jgi:putative aldouronate transport system substrate-binding protein
MKTLKFLRFLYKNKGGIIMKRIMTLILAAVLMFSFAACGGSNVKNSKKNNSKESSSKEKESNEKKAEEKITLKMVMKDEQPTDPVVVKYIESIEKGMAEEGINVDIELIEMPGGNYAEKLNLMLLSGKESDIPDIIYFQGGDTQIAKQGLLEDLTPYIEKSKYIKSNLEPHNVKRLNNYPYLLWIKPINSKVPVIRKDWFDKMKTSKTLMDNPTIDNYYEFLKELKNSNLGGEGSPAFALTVAGKLRELDEIFDQSFGNTATWVKDENGKFIYNRVSKYEKEKLAFYNKLYNEGILDPEYLTKKWDTKEKVFYDNKAGLIVGTSGKVIDIYDGKMKKANGEDITLKVLPPAKGVGHGYKPMDVIKETRGVAISTVSKHKDVAFQVLDYLASPKGQRLDRLGFENEHYEVKDGKVHLTEKSQEWYARFWEPTKIDLGIELATPLLGEAGEDSLKKAKEFYSEDVNFIIPDEFVAKWDAMTNLYKEFSADIITGKRPINDFDTFTDKWYKSGGDEITKYANEVLK